MTKVDLAEMILEEAQRQAQEPKPKPLGKKYEEQEPATPIAKKELKPKAKSKAEQEVQPKEPPIPRRNAWILESQYDRLDDLKKQEKQRLKQQGKTASVRSLLDEAVEMYLEEMEKGAGRG